MYRVGAKRSWSLMRKSWCGRLRQVARRWREIERYWKKKKLPLLSWEASMRGKTDHAQLRQMNYEGLRCSEGSAREEMDYEDLEGKCWRLVTVAEKERSVKCRRVLLLYHSTMTKERERTSGHWPNRNGRVFKELLHESVCVTCWHSSTSNWRRQIAICPCADQLSEGSVKWGNAASKWKIV